jgi:hypothetical protein
LTTSFPTPCSGRCCPARLPEVVLQREGGTPRRLRGLAVRPLHDPYATSFRKSRYVIHSQFMDVEQVYDMWGVEVKPRARRPTWSRPRCCAAWARPRSCRASRSTSCGTSPTALPEGPLRRVGRRQAARAAPGRCPSRTASRAPAVHAARVHRAPDSLHYMSPVKYLRSPQMELNKYHAQRIMIREKFANPKWWIPSELELQETPTTR